jgi:hypothetical protein
MLRQCCANAAPMLRQCCANAAPMLCLAALFLSPNSTLLAQGPTSVKGKVEKWGGTSSTEMNSVEVNIFNPFSAGGGLIGTTNTGVIGGGKYTIPWNPAPGVTKYRTFAMKVVNDFWMNGVSTFDLTEMTKHILATTPFTSGFQKIAADVNKSGTVTTADVVELRKLILAINSSLPSWDRPTQFVPKRVTEAASSNFHANPNNFNLIINNVLTAHSYQSSTGYLSHSYELNILNTEAHDNPKCGYWGVKIGDVNASFTANKVAHNNGEKELAIKSEDRSSTVFFNQSSPIFANQEATLLVRASNFNDITAFQMGLGFDKSKIEILSSEASDLDWVDDESFGLTHLADGEFRMLAFHPSGEVATMANDDVLYKIHIRALEDIYDLSQIINFDDEILQTVFYHADGNEASEITINFEVVNDENSAKTVKAYPNPSNGNVNLEFESDVAGEAQMELINFTGSSILTQDNAVSKGKNTISLDITNQNTGHYFYKIKLPNNVLTGRIIRR